MDGSDVLVNWSSNSGVRHFGRTLLVSRHMGFVTTTGRWNYKHTEATQIWLLRITSFFQVPKLLSDPYRYWRPFHDLVVIQTSRQGRWPLRLDPQVQSQVPSLSSSWSTGGWITLIFILLIFMQWFFKLFINQVHQFLSLMHVGHLISVWKTRKSSDAEWLSAAPRSSCECRICPALVFSFLSVGGEIKGI